MVLQRREKAALSAKSLPSLYLPYIFINLHFTTAVQCCFAPCLSVLHRSGNSLICHTFSLFVLKINDENFEALRHASTYLRHVGRQTISTHQLLTTSTAHTTHHAGSPETTIRTGRVYESAAKIQKTRSDKIAVICCKRQGRTALTIRVPSFVHWPFLRLRGMEQRHRLLRRNTETTVYDYNLNPTPNLSLLEP